MNTYEHRPIKQNILISSSNKSDISNLNNDITLRFPNKIFFKPPSEIQLVNFSAKYETTVFGNTNNHFVLTINPDYPSNFGNIKDYNVVPHFNPALYDDQQLAAAIEAALNVEVTEFINPSLTQYPAGGGPNPDIPPVPSSTYDTYPGLSFICSYTTIEIIIDNYQIEQDDSTSIYTITATRPVKFQFDVKDSIGPLIGFGNGVYDNVTSLEGTSVQSIEKYHSISVLNDSKLSLQNNIFPFPNFNDIDCKMDLYDSTNIRIPNIDHPGTPGSYDTDPGDITISIGAAGTALYYKNIWNLLLLLETELNRYSASYTPPAEFRIYYDYRTNLITMKNIGGLVPARWGFSFDFALPDNGVRVTSGSLHKILGFVQNSYFGQTEYTSVVPSRTFSNIFADDYLLLCSDLISNNTDRNVIGISNGDALKSNNILFAIPVSSTDNFTPISIEHYTLNIESSAFSIGYREGEFDDENRAELNFYLRLLSGRHIQSTVNWTALLSFTY
jgi:hypothetical protein